MKKLLESTVVDEEAAVEVVGRVERQTQEQCKDGFQSSSGLSACLFKPFLIWCALLGPNSKLLSSPLHLITF